MMWKASCWPQYQVVQWHDGEGFNSSSAAGSLCFEGAKHEVNSYRFREDRDYHGQALTRYFLRHGDSYFRHRKYHQSNTTIYVVYLQDDQTAESFFRNRWETKSTMSYLAVMRYARNDSDAVALKPFAVSTCYSHGDLSCLWKILHWRKLPML